LGDQDLLAQREAVNLNIEANGYVKSLITAGKARLNRERRFY